MNCYKIVLDKADLKMITVRLFCLYTTPAIIDSNDAAY